MNNWSALPEQVRKKIIGTFVHVPHLLQKRETVSCLYIATHTTVTHLIGSAVTAEVHQLNTSTVEYIA